MGIVEEEADESLFWLELLIEAQLIDKEKLKALMREIDEILAIVVASIKTAKRK
jgi:four helix bundle protein